MSSIVNQSMLPAMGEEALPAFDTNMYPNGVNANFYNLEKLPAEQVLGKFAGIFEDKESRDIARVAPDLIKMLASFGLVEGARVVDVGCGTGLLLTRLSNAVGSTGSVVATEISEVFYNHLLKKVESEGLSNVTCLLNDNPRNPQIDQYQGTVDLILVIDVYHHLEYPRTFMRHLKDALKPTGHLVVLDFIRDEEVHKSHPTGWISAHVRGDQNMFRGEIESAGFVLKEDIQPLSGSRAGQYSIDLVENYIMVFRPATADELSSVVGTGWAQPK